MQQQILQQQQQANQQYQQALAMAKEKSQAEIDAEADRAAKRSYRMKGDFRAPPAGLVGLAYGPESARRREMEKTAAPMGIFGMGGAYANPTALALAQQNMADTNARGDAEAYQGDVRAYLADDQGQALMAQDFARRMGLLGNTSNMSQFMLDQRRQATPQSILPMLLSGLIGGAGTALSGGFGAGGAFGSDSRLKERIERLDGIHAVAFEWNEAARLFGFEPGAKDVGVIADQVERVLPQFAGMSPLGYRVVNYRGLAAYLLELLKEQNRERRLASA